MAGYNVRSNNSQQPKSTRNEVFGINNIDGLYIGTVTDNKDSLYTGRIKVRIPEFGSDPNEDNSILCLLSTPFGGITSVKDSTEQIASDEGSPKKLWHVATTTRSRITCCCSIYVNNGTRNFTRFAYYKRQKLYDGWKCK